MYRFFYFAGLLIVIFIMMFLLNKLREKTTNELEKVLYIQNNPKLYLELLKNSKLKILYRKSALLQLELNAYLIFGEDSQIEHIIKLLDKIIMTKGESLEYNEKKLSYYCSKGKKEKAEEALNKLEELLSKVKGEKAALIRKESKLIFHIYIGHDTKLIEELEKSLEYQQGISRGITLFRLAKLNYFDKNNKRAQEFLLEAKKLLKGTAWYNITEAALGDLSVLNYK